MRFSTSAIYFDGKTSKPHLLDLEVFLNEHVSFYFENRKLVWKFQDLHFEKNGDFLTITRKENLSESIKIDNPESVKLIYQSAKKSKNLSWYQNILDLGAKFYITATLAIITLIACFYIFIIPWIGEKTADILPISFDEQLGNTSYHQIKAFSKIDEEKSIELQKFANQIDFETDRKLNFKVINDDEINAFALPNGTIVVYTGLLSKINNYEELAALLGHEATHVKERHSTKTLARSIAGYLLVSIVIGDASGITTSLANNANELNNLSFSRDFEKSSDKGSYEILKKNKIDPKGLSDLFTTLKNSHNLEVPSMLSTHPLTEDRIDFSKKMIAKKEYVSSKNAELTKLFDNLKK